MADDFDNLWQTARTATDETESIQTLAAILSSVDGQAFILNLEPSDAELCIGILDRGLAKHDIHASEKQALFFTLIELSGKHAQLPESMVITDEIDFSARRKSIAGGFADILPGNYGGGTVAVKTLRLSMNDDFEKIRKQFCKEVVLWNSLSHPNILKLVGVLYDVEQYQFATVSEWMAHGNIMEYIKANATNRLELLRGAGEGLKYLHDANLIHGDLKGANILITNDVPPMACLADFGFTTVVPDPENLVSPILELEGGTVMFMAPELLAPSKYGLTGAVPTQEADIYAFGLVVFQVLTGEQPFRDIRPRELAFSVLAGARPAKPENAVGIGFSEILWNLVQKCWDGEVARRPQIQEVVEGIGKVATSWFTSMPPGIMQRAVSDVEDDEDEDEDGVSEELKHAAVFELYQGEDIPFADTSADTSRSGDSPTIPTESAKVETNEVPGRQDPSPTTACRRKKRERFRRLLKKIPVILRGNPV